MTNAQTPAAAELAQHGARLVVGLFYASRTPRLASASSKSAATSSSSNSFRRDVGRDHSSLLGSRGILVDVRVKKEVLQRRRALQEQEAVAMLRALADVEGKDVQSNFRPRTRRSPLSFLISVEVLERY